MVLSWSRFRFSELSTCQRRSNQGAHFHWTEQVTFSFFLLSSTKDIEGNEYAVRPHVANHVCYDGIMRTIKPVGVWVGHPSFHQTRVVWLCARNPCSLLPASSVWILFLPTGSGSRRKSQTLTLTLTGGDNESEIDNVCSSIDNDVTPQPDER